jgi:hypothetical protein
MFSDESHFERRFGSQKICCRVLGSLCLRVHQEDYEALAECDGVGQVQLERKRGHWCSSGQEK